MIHARRAFAGRNAPIRRRFRRRTPGRTRDDRPAVSSIGGGVLHIDCDRLGEGDFRLCLRAGFVQLLLRRFELFLRPLPLLGRHIPACRIQPGTGGLHPRFGGFQAGVRSLHRLSGHNANHPLRSSGVFPLHGGVLGNADRPDVSGQLFQVAGIDVPPVYFPDHVSAERVAPAVDPVGHRTHPPRKGIRLRPGSAHHDGSRTAVAAVRERLHLRVGTALLRRDDNHAVPALFTVLGFRRSILEHRNRSDPVGRQRIDRFHFAAVHQNQRIAGFSVRRVDFCVPNENRNIFFFTFVIRKYIGGAGEGSEGESRKRQHEKHSGYGPPRRSFT